jgi:hypothetical protein
MRADLTKRQRAILRELAGRAWEAELHHELMKLSAEFERWKAGELHSFDLNQEIHRFHNGASRELYNRYTTRGVENAQVAYAVVKGLIPAAEVPPEIMEHLAPELSFYRSGLVDLDNDAGP